MNNYLDINIIKGVFLLILALFGNFIAETLGCQSQKLLSENMLAKHLIIIMFIFFSINLTVDSDIHPNINILKSIFVWILFVLFTKMSINFTIIVFLLIMIVYIIGSYINYYKKNNKETKILSSIQTNLYYLIVFLIIIGFIFYLKKQYADYKDNWDTLTFLFGKTICKSRK